MDEQKNKSHESRFTVPAIIIAVLLVLYVLSIGPVFKILIAQPNRPAAEKFFVIFYAPIIWGCDTSESCEKVMTAYVRLWVKDL